MKPYILKRNQPLDQRSRQVVWLPDSDEVGVLHLSAVETLAGRIIQPTALVILSDEQTFVKWVLHGRGQYLSVNEYARRFGVSRWTTSRYVKSNLARALGALNGMLPDSVPPAVWLDIFLSRLRKSAVREDQIVAYISRFGAQRLHHLTFHFSTSVRRPTVRRSINKLVAEGKLVKRGSGRGAILSIPAKEMLDKPDE